MDFIQQNLHWVVLAAASGGWLIFDLIRNRNDTSRVGPIDATMMINREDAQVIDVREPGEFSAGHIPGAINIPAGDIERRKGELDKYGERPLILYCATGMRSSGALKTLVKSGRQRVYNLNGGLPEWEKAGQPVTRIKTAKKAAKGKA